MSRCNKDSPPHQNNEYRHPIRNPASVIQQSDNDLLSGLLFCCPLALYNELSFDLGHDLVMKHIVFDMWVYSDVSGSVKKS